MTEYRPGRPTEREPRGGSRPAHGAGRGLFDHEQADPGPDHDHRAGGHPDDAYYDDDHDVYYDDHDGYHEAGYYDDHDAGYHDEHGYDGHGAGWPGVTDTGAPSYRRAGRPRNPGRGRRRGVRRHPVLAGLAVIVVLILVIAGGGFLWAEGQINPGGKRGPAVSVVIPKGASTSRIGSILASAGVIHSGTLFAYYVRLHGDGPLYPGSYSLARNSPYSSAISALEAGPKILTEDLVIPEGFTLRQIADKVATLPHMGLSAARFMAAATGGSVRSPYEPAGVNNLEGLLFPATYQVRQGETEVDILEQMVGAFNDRASQLGLDAAATKLGYTPYQVVTVASIVERESKLAADRGPVASTIYNRLRIGMKLGADSTQTYYLRLTDPTIQPTPAQLDTPSPYNTRTDKGLPPTPIANPSLASLQAAITPPATNYLYFVEINPDGKLGFASDSQGFVGLQQQCRAAKLC